MEKEPTKPSTVESKENLDLRILIAEDDYQLGPMLEMMLGPKSSSVKLVASGPELVKELISNPTHNIVFTDNDMPGEDDGLKAIREIRTMKQFEHLPIVLMSGKMDAKSADFYKEFEELKVVVMTKPFRLGDFDKIVKAAKEKVG